ncbi:hypothetical protein MLD52_07010 [Puniceicoccaceae bacterium K14]|nr:hypothetical protein [Puniceicoccaceae bacterium K14]
MLNDSVRTFFNRMSGVVGWRLDRFGGFSAVCWNCDSRFFAANRPIARLTVFGLGLGDVAA